MSYFRTIKHGEQLRSALLADYNGHWGRWIGLTGDEAEMIKLITATRLMKPDLRVLDYTTWRTHTRGELLRHNPSTCVIPNPQSKHKQLDIYVLKPTRFSIGKVVQSMDPNTYKANRKAILNGTFNNQKKVQAEVEKQLAATRSNQPADVRLLSQLQQQRDYRARRGQSTTLYDDQIAAIEARMAGEQKAAEVRSSTAYEYCIGQLESLRKLTKDTPHAEVLEVEAGVFESLVNQDWNAANDRWQSTVAKLSTQLDLEERMRRRAAAEDLAKKESELAKAQLAEAQRNAEHDTTVAELSVDSGD